MLLNATKSCCWHYYCSSLFMVTSGAQGVKSECCCPVDGGQTHTQTWLQSRCYAICQATVMHFKDGLVLLTSLYRITMVRAWGEVMFVASDTSPGTHSMPPVTTRTGKINYAVIYQILFGPPKISVVFKVCSMFRKICKTKMQISNQFYLSAESCNYT